MKIFQSIKLNLLIVGLFFSLSLIAQENNVSFTVAADAKQVVMGSYFEVNFTLSNADGKNFKPPSFNDFVMLNKSPNQSTSARGINGKWTRTLTLSYSLQPKRTGKFTIGPASIVVEGKTLRSKPLTIEVLKGSNVAAQDKDKQMYIQAVLSTEEAMIGQQVLLDYKLFTTVAVENYNITEESDYQGFFANEVRRFNARQVREVIDGVQYTTKILKRVALFPQQAGALTIEPLYANLGVAVKNKNKPRSFFSFRQLVNHGVQTNAIRLNVKPLPANPPPSFTGGVGKFSVSSSTSRNNLSTDDALSLRMTIDGNGDIKRVQAPDLNLGEDFEVYEPKVIEEKNFDAAGEIKAKKVVEYLVLPKKPGRYNLQPEFSYYDVDSAGYVTLSPERFPINVKKGTNTTANLNVAPQKEEVKEDIRFIKLDSSLSRNRDSFFGSSLFVGLLLLPLLALGGVLVFKQVQNSRNNIDAGVLKQRRAKKQAEKRFI